MTRQRLPRNSLLRLTLTCALAFSVGACNPATFFGKTTGSLAGKVAGGQIAAAVDDHAATVAADNGGDFCAVMEHLKWPPKPEAGNVLQPGLARAVLGALEHGAKHCGWKPPPAS